MQPITASGAGARLAWQPLNNARSTALVVPLNETESTHDTSPCSRRPPRPGEPRRPGLGCRWRPRGRRAVLLGPAGLRTRGQRGRPARVGLHARAPARAARRQAEGLGALAARRLRAGQAGGQGHQALARGRPPHLHPPRHAGRLGPDPDARRGEGLRRRQVAQGLRQARRPPAGLAALRRTPGPPLARPDPLRRLRRLQQRRHAPQHLALPRLRHRVVQPGQAVRPLRQGTGRRRRDLARPQRGADRHRLPAQLPRRDQRA